MKSIEKITSWDHDNTTYQIDRITEDNQITIILRDLMREPYGVVSVIRYPNKGILEDFPMMNWENVIRCSNYYGIPPEEINPDGTLGYMSRAVQLDLKPAVTMRCDINDPIIEKLTMSLPNTCLIVPYKEEHTTFICHKGRLSDIYNLDEIKKRYHLYGITGIDWNRVEELYKKELAFFSDDLVSGISIETGASNNTEYVITGMLLGYPVESTVAKFNRTESVFDMIYKQQAEKQIRTTNNPYVDPFRNTWVERDSHVFIEGQQEKLYY